jgi:hypothetical protein
MPTFVLVLLVVFVLLAAVATVRHRDPEKRARAMRRFGFGWMAVFAVLAGLFIAGETFDDPGGVAAVGMVLAWLVPLVLLAWLAWARPALAEPLLGVLLAGVVVYSLWSVTGWEGYQAFRDQRGPYDAVAVFVVSVSLAVLGLQRPLAAGLMLLVSSLVPVTVLAVGAGAPLRDAVGGSLGAAALPGLVTAGLFLLAYRTQHHTVGTRSTHPASPAH